MIMMYVVTLTASSSCYVGAESPLPFCLDKGVSVCLGRELLQGTL